MINHIRTLLLNRARSQSGPEQYGEEYIEATFRPRQLPDGLKRFQQIVFGSQPDRVYMNYRMHQIMTLLHASRFQGDITQVDSRLTYLAFHSDWFAELFRVRTLISNPAVTVYLLGDHVADETLGQCRQQWRIDSVSNVVTVTKQTPPLATTTATAVYVSGLSNPIGLPGSATTLRIQQRTPTDFQLQLELIGRPTSDIVPLLQRAADSLSEQGLADIFPPRAPEPFATWYRAWSELTDTPDRLAALLLAIATYTETLPVV